MPPIRPPFSGTYAPDDVVILMEPVDLPPTPADEREALIRSEGVHYSETVPEERPPDPTYLGLYHEALARNAERVAGAVCSLSHKLAQRAARPWVLVSLVRAGVPIGVLLRRVLAHLGFDVPHYAISLVRDRGIDDAALDIIRAAHPEAEMVFVDGWTGKGAIKRELTHALRGYGDRTGVEIQPTLAVLSDLAGVADVAADQDDYLIPSAILGAVISGLVSRSVLPRGPLRSDKLHQCVFFEGMSRDDLSGAFIDTISDAAFSYLRAGSERSERLDSETRRRHVIRFCRSLSDAFGVEDAHRIKPGVGEATRALLRRRPDHVLCADLDSPEIAHLLHLARAHEIVPEYCPAMPFQACVITRGLGRSHGAWLLGSEYGPGAVDVS